MQWLNEPASWQRSGDLLKVSVDPGTDFWRETGYGYIHDNGHVYGEVVAGDLDVSVRVRAAFTSPYDQAGIMLRLDGQAWVKSGLEQLEGRARLSTVLTLGRSSWTVTDLPDGVDEVTLRASRRGDAVEIRYSAGGGAPELAALVFLPPGADVLAGVMCAAPEGPGFTVTFQDLRVSGRSWGGQAPAAPGWEAPSGGAAPGWDEVPAAPAGWTGTAWPPQQNPASDTAAGDAATSPHALAGDAARLPAGPGAASLPGSGAPGDSQPAPAQPAPAQPTAEIPGAGPGQAGPAPEPAPPAKPAKNGRMRGKAKQAAAPVTPAPEDAADEWISLLTAADPADDWAGA